MNDCCAVPGGDSKPRAYDLAVIGAGSAGFSAAITAANLGARVALIGHGTIGGTCVNIGCVPSKTLLRAAEAVHAVQSVTRFPGLAGTATLTGWSALMAAKDELVVTLRRQKYADLLPGYETIDYIEGQARFADGMLTVGGAPLQSGKIVLATGAAPATFDAASDIDGQSHTFRGPLNLAITEPGPHRDPLVAEIAGQRRRYLRFALRQQAAARHQGHLRAKPREQLGQLAADIATANDQ